MDSGSLFTTTPVPIRTSRRRLNLLSMNHDSFAPPRRPNRSTGFATERFTMLDDVVVRRFVLTLSGTEMKSGSGAKRNSKLLKFPHSPFQPSVAHIAGTAKLRVGRNLRRKTQQNWLQRDSFLSSSSSNNSGRRRSPCPGKRHVGHQTASTGTGFPDYPRPVLHGPSDGRQ